MALIKSISGIRGTIGGKAGDALTPYDIVKFSAAYGTWIKQRSGKKATIVIGRDARISGEMVRSLVSGTLIGLGIDVIDLGLSTTPTVEIAVPEEKADGGIIITASHNPKQWNALKLLNEKGEFISDADGKEVLALTESDGISFAEVTHIGKYTQNNSYLQKHIDKILALGLVDVEAIKKAEFTVAVDAVNSTGGIYVPELLTALGVKKVIKLYCDPTGDFPHNPEPLPENLLDIAKEVKKSKAHLGIVVDPDVDRLTIVCEDGEMFGEEYTLVAVADYILKNTKGNTVSNMSSTRALRDVTQKHGGSYEASAVGEVNVVELMKKNNAIIGGEGNGGIIYPELHYGRDALVGIALFLTHLAKSGKSCSKLRYEYPNYYISKNKIELTPEINVDEVLERIKDKYKKYPVNTVDGVKIEFDTEWVHLRRSNTEPIIRIYAESANEVTANTLAKKIISDIKEVLQTKV
ncbi:MAG: phosphoglucosamine mutase [Sphingobacteriales bacterium JAD_PAG50586_3]|nr:MAG: phosphoglucosamine mutase [Sphingobacteriales bacterium JAD_PAG50586_3]